MRMLFMLDRDGHAVSGTLLSREGSPVDQYDGKNTTGINITAAVELFNQLTEAGEGVALETHQL